MPQGTDQCQVGDYASLHQELCTNANSVKISKGERCSLCSLPGWNFSESCGPNESFRWSKLCVAVCGFVYWTGFLHKPGKQGPVGFCILFSQVKGLRAEPSWIYVTRDAARHCDRRAAYQHGDASCFCQCMQCLDEYFSYLIETQSNIHWTDQERTG